MLVRRLVPYTLALGIVASGSTNAIAQERVGSSVSAVVYGTDDRRDWYQIPDPAMQALGRESIVALVPAAAIDLVTPGLKTPPFVDGTPALDEMITSYYGLPLCVGQRYATQPTAAICSGTLIDDDLVVTAGHCATSQAECEALKFVFDYFEASDGVLEPIDASDVYGCGRLLAHHQQQSPHIDYAVIQLDRPVVGRVPVSVAPSQTPVAASTPLRLFGFGSGLPMKYDAGGSVYFAASATLDSFTTNTDTFGGNSGSGVFTTDGTLVGILVSGQEDYVTGSTCTSVNVVPESQAGEECTYAFRAIDALCGDGFPSAACPGNPPPTCGDHFCSGGEDAASCATDCAGPHCADGVCSTDAGESLETCPYDCTTPAPGPRSAHGRCSVGLAGAPQASEAPAWAATAALSTLLLRRRRRR